MVARLLSAALAVVAFTALSRPSTTAAAHIPHSGQEKELPARVQHELHARVQAALVQGARVQGELPARVQGELLARVQGALAPKADGFPPP